MFSQPGYLILQFSILFLSGVYGKNGNSSLGPILLEVINQPSSPDDLPGTLKLTEGATLNLTCRVASHGDNSGEVRLSWYLPNNFHAPQTRLEQTGKDSTSTLVISPVIETDTGDYECWASHKGSTTNNKGSDQVKKVLRVMIEPRRGTCQPGQYQCEGQDKYCIATRFRCDSREDCPSGDDESELLCGRDPCKGKITCPDLNFRCIDPTEYCCDPESNPDCKFSYRCCESVIEFSLRKRLSAHYRSTETIGKPEKEYRESDLAYLHSTVYTIIGCAVAFLIIVMALVVAICRLHILRKSNRNNVIRGAGRAHPPITLHDLDIYFSERSEEERGDFQHIGITYNINHGVQIMGRQGQPPPYSTTPRRGVGRGPPPPYMSNENIAEPLLNAGDDNNNGDINGNSDMADNNVIFEEATVQRAERLNSHQNQSEAVTQASISGNIESLPSRSRPQTPHGARSSPPPRYPGLERRGYSSTDTDTE